MRPTCVSQNAHGTMAIPVILGTKVCAGRYVAEVLRHMVVPEDCELRVLDESRQGMVRAVHLKINALS